MTSGENVIFSALKDTNRSWNLNDNLDELSIHTYYDGCASPSSLKSSKVWWVHSAFTRAHRSCEIKGELCRKSTLKSEDLVGASYLWRLYHSITYYYYEYTKHGPDCWGLGSCTTRMHFLFARFPYNRRLMASHVPFFGDLEWVQKEFSFIFWWP